MSTLAAYRTRLTNSLNDTTTKYSNDVLDEALRKILSEYTRAFPNIIDQEITLTSAGRTQSLSACTNLINIIQLIHPYDDSRLDPYVYEREDYVITWQGGAPIVFFNRSGYPPQW